MCKIIQVRNNEAITNSRKIKRPYKKRYVIIVLQLGSAMDNIYLVITKQIENANLNKTMSGPITH